MSRRILNGLSKDNAEHSFDLDNRSKTVFVNGFGVIKSGSVDTHGDVTYGSSSTVFVEGLSPVREQDVDTHGDTEQSTTNCFAG